MVEIKSQRTIYDVSNSNTVLSLTGTVEVHNGSVKKVTFYVKNQDNKYVNYNQNTDDTGRINESVSGDGDILESSRTFAKKTITEFETNLNKK